MPSYPKNRILYLSIPFLIVIVLLLLYPYNAQNIYKDNYLVDTICLFVCIVMLSFYYIRNGFDLFEPITIVSFIYLGMYFVTPINDILTETYLWYGYNLFSSGIKASIYELLGFIAFFVFYCSRYRFVIGNEYYYATKNEISNTTGINNEEYSNRLVGIILFIYFVCFFANAYYLVHHFGNSLLYVLTLGMIGSVNTTATRGSIEIIGILSYSLPGATMLYWEYGRSKALKVLLFIPMFMMQVARGYRFIIFAIALSFITYYYEKRNKRPKLISIIVCLFVLLVPVLIMTMFRNSIRYGNGLTFSGISFSDIQKAFDDTFWYNLRIYRNFYGMLEVIPSKYGFVYFRQIVVGTLTMVIPRFLWPGKVSSWGGEALDVLIGSNLARTGQAYPSIGEYYYGFGIIGIIVFMALYGYATRRIRDKLKYSDSRLDHIEHAILLGCNLQFIIRGYMPTNFWYIIFSILPVWICKKYIGYKR